MILRLDNGNFKIKPKSSESYSNDWCAAAGNGIGNFNGRNVEQRNYVADDELIDEWTILSADVHPFPSNRVVNVDVLYDRGFAERNAGHINETINANLRRLKEFYSKKFGIQISFNNPHPYISLSDQCKTINYDELCTCTPTSSVGFDNHHKNIDRNIESLYPTSGDLCIRIAFSGHVSCYNRDGRHRMVYGVAGENMCLVANQEAQYLQIKTLIHEVGHLYGAPDHNGTGGVTTDRMNNESEIKTFNSDCIFGENKDYYEIASELKICNGCSEMISQNKTKYNHK